MSFQNSKKYRALKVTIDYPIDDLKLELKGLSNIINHFESEYDFWNQEVFQNQPIFNDIAKHFKRCLSLSSEFYESNKETDPNVLDKDWKNKKSVLKLKNTGRSNFSLISSKSKVAPFLKNLLEENQIEGVFAFYYLVGNNVNYNTLEKLRGILKAYEFDYENSGFKKRRKAEKISVAHLKNSLQQSKDELFNEFLAFSDDFNSWFYKKKETIEIWQKESQKSYDKKINEGKKRLLNLEETYSDYMSLRAPVKFWEKRIEQYGNSGYLWSILLAIVIVLLGGSVFKLLYHPPEIFDASFFSGDPLAIKAIILFATLISLGAYFLKTCSRMIFSSFHLKRDAEERHQLTMVYLSLKEKGHISDDERDLILQALFSRSETGLLKGDNSPTMPGIQGFLERLGIK
ncbi:MAG: DUF6161 domain-containing protein [Gracilimonas sp.]